MTDGSLTMIDHLIDVLIKLQERRLRRPRLKSGAEFNREVRSGHVGT